MLKCILLGDTFEYILLPCNMVISRSVLYTVIDIYVGPPFKFPLHNQKIVALCIRLPEFRFWKIRLVEYLIKNIPLLVREI
jgi:hypothetical protein